VFAGGIADKLGNRYEAKWLVRQLLDVIGGKAQSLRFEGISKDFRGFEFSANRNGKIEWHQTKIKNPNGNWTLSALKREGILEAFKRRLNENQSNICVFVSEDPAKDIGALAEKADVATTLDEYLEALGKGQAEKLKELSLAWEVDDGVAFEWLKRTRFRTESESSIEAIRANGGALSSLINRVLDSPSLFHAGWDGAEWKSFADAAKEAIPHINNSDVIRIEARILAHQPELSAAVKFAARLRAEGESEPWFNRKTIISYLNRSGYDQWCILEIIDHERLSVACKSRLAELRTKFSEHERPEPHHHEAHWVQSPIKRDKAALMNDVQWLGAIERYNNDNFRRRERTFTDGGAEQLAGELQHAAKENPNRFATLLITIPNSAHESYIRHLLLGLAEADDVEDEPLRLAIMNAHCRPGKPYGSEIGRLFGKRPALAAGRPLFDILVWYLEQGEASGNNADEASGVDREVSTIEDLMNDASRIHVRGLNNARGVAAEALSKVLWNVPQVIGVSWGILERRADEELLISVRCCLMSPTVAVYNDDRDRCAALAERLSRAPNGDLGRRFSAFLSNAWLICAFPVERLPRIVRSASVFCCDVVEKIVQRYERSVDHAIDKWWPPLLTHSGVYLLPFIIRSTPAVGRRLIYQLIVCGNETSRMIGAWHVFRCSFQDACYAPLADLLAEDGVIYRRLLAAIASHAVTIDEYRYRAEHILQRSFEDEDRQVRHQAIDVFRNIKPAEFYLYRELSNKFLRSRAFEAESWAFFHALGEAECKVDDIVVSATERLINDIQRDGNSGRRSMDLHQLQDIIKKEYASSESDPDLRRRLLDLIDSMLSLELYGVEEIIKVHER
jgi:hypothetical protein